MALTASNKKLQSSLSDTEIEVKRKQSKENKQKTEPTQAIAKLSKTTTSIATQRQTSKTSTTSNKSPAEKQQKNQIKRQAPKKPARLTKPSDASITKQPAAKSPGIPVAVKYLNEPNGIVEPKKVEIQVKKRVKKTSNASQVSLEGLPPPVDCKSLHKDELLSLLRSANEITPINLTTSIICSFAPSKGTNKEIAVKKGDTVSLFYVLDGSCFIITKKGKSGFVPFTCISASLALANPTPNTRRKLFGKFFVKRSVSSDSNNNGTLNRKTSKESNEKTLSADSKKDKPSKVLVKKNEAKVSNESVSSKEETETKSKASSSEEEVSKISKKGRTNSEDYALAEIKPKGAKGKRVRLEPLKDHSAESGSPTIHHRSFVESISESEDNIFQKRKEADETVRSKSIDFLADSSPKTFKRRAYDSEIDDSELDHYIAPLRAFGTRTSSLDTSDELGARSHSSISDKHPYHSADELDFGRPHSSIGGRESGSGYSKYRDLSLERLLSPITQRKLKTFSGNDRDMNKLKLFGRKLGVKTGTKEKGLRKTSSSSSKMSDSEMSTSSLSTQSSLVRINNKRNGGRHSKHNRTHSLTGGYHLSWYRDLNLEPSDSSDSEDDYATTDTESINVRVKTTIRKERSLSDCESKIISNRVRNRRTSDVSASSDMYVPKQQILRESNNNNTKNENTNSSAFAQVYKTRSALQIQGKSSSTDILGSENKQERHTNLQKNRLSSSNSSLRSSKSKRKITYSSDNDFDVLHSPLKPFKAGETAADILRGKSTLPKQTSPSIDQILGNLNDNVMIVKSDFIAQEENYVTILTCEHVKVLRKPDSEWWWVQASSGKEGFVPKDFLMEKPKIPSRKPNINSLQSDELPKNDLNNNADASKMASSTVTLPSLQSLKSRDPTTLLAKVAPLVRNDTEKSEDNDDIAMSKKEYLVSKYLRPTTTTPLPPSYDQFMLTRQKSDLTDTYHKNYIPRYSSEEFYEQSLSTSRQWKSQERFSYSAAAKDPGGAARVVRRRSFSGRQKKVRFSNEVSSDDGGRYQNSPGQILIVRQPPVSVGSEESYNKENNSDDNETETATWC